MNVGVIGGSGFIGSHVVDKLFDAGHNVTVLDGVKPQRNDVGYKVIDITDLENTLVTLDGGYDAIYLLAAMADVNDCYKNPVKTIEVNVLGVANVLEACVKNEIERFLFASTVWTYGLSDVEVVDESTPLNITNKEHIYTASKVAAETLIQSYSNLYHQDFTILRYGIPYGPRARGGTVLPIFVRLAMEGKPLTIQGDGSAHRKFIYVEDIAYGNVAALSPDAKNQVINLEGPRNISVKEVADTVNELFNGDVEINYVEARPGDYAGKVVSNDKSKKLLDWEPLVDFKEGAKNFLDWYKENSQ
ncbi:MAG: hypothetical protein BD935_00115 [Marine Group III euryarchaeote CG-Epi1]|uniref:NAD-dependent epimerase/dehydratase domain-containing protein n=1 Tax=Marine Group III euryarchaeote CG-Epi1 TaxID=1888995 RepID=A0A1J5UA86_9ARCH|nr:MAG: hypothetical protein BD935_00115 [Marine Group III euryarchaeote CG-Epi1]